MNQRVKISFTLVQDEDGYPPDSCERVYAKTLANGNYEIDNIPFFIYGISCGDEISAQLVDDQLAFEQLVVRSGNSTFRLISKRKEDSPKIREIVRELGCPSEMNARLNLIAVEVPSSVSIQPFIDYIVTAKAHEELDYEEGALRHAL
jgi:hypothetical protein